jgi:tetratricopeptide (TPR) repeat protein
VRSGALIVGIVSFSLLAAARVEAQEDEQETEVQRTAMARSLFAQGVELMAEERYEAAAAHFERSLELRESPVVHYNLASALVRLERFVEAVEHLQRVLRNEEAPARAREAAEQLMQEAEPKVGYLTIDVEGDPTDVSITLDYRELPSAAVGVAVPVDPGARTVVIRRGEEIVAQGVAEVSEGRSAVLTLQVPPPPPPPEPEPEPPAGTGFVPGGTLLEELPESRRPEPEEADVPNPEEVARRERERQERERRERARTETEESETIWENPWFWTGVGAGVVVAVVVATVVALIVVSEPAQGIAGTLEPGIVELGR